MQRIQILYKEKGKKHQLKDSGKTTPPPRDTEHKRNGAEAK